MLAEGNAVMGFRDQGVDRHGKHSIDAFMMRRREKLTELLWLIKAKFGGGHTGFHLW